MVAWRWRNVPLPEFHLGGLAAGILLNLLLSWRLFPEAWMGHAFGWPLVLAGLSLAAWAVIAAADIDMERPTGVVVTGPFAFSRNPMYVAWGFLFVGVAFLVNTWWPVALFPVVLMLTHVQVVREERVLGERFGPAYRDYRGRVRRYL
jgi:protein-S-isoprenylcysteine O-methyltransferase Ste14